MKQLSKVIHPELLLDLRGDPHWRKVLKGMMECLHYSEEQKAWEVKGFLLDQMTKDKNAPAIAFTLKRFVESKEKKVFYVPKDFARAISRIDKGMPTSILKKGFAAYFEFATDTFEGGIQGGYVYIDSAVRMGLGDAKNGDLGWRLNGADAVPEVEAAESQDFEKLCISVVYIYNNGSCARYSADIREDFSIKERLEAATEAHGHGCVGTVNNTVFQCLINAAIYVHSSDPDVANLIPKREMTKPQREASRRKFDIENMCTLPITVLNRSYALGREYANATSVVGAFLRWQRHGKGNSQVKLILIEEFVRRNPGAREQNI